MLRRRKELTGNPLRFRCPRCKHTDELVRVSVEEIVREAEVGGMHGRPEQPWVAVKRRSEQVVARGRKTKAVECRRCGYTGPPGDFIV